MENILSIMERPLKRGIISLVVVVILIGAYMTYQELMIYSHSRKENSPNENAVIVISLNFGEKEILRKVVPAGKSVLDTLKTIANVTTAYGGKFVIGIDNITSDPINHRDWFYYVNGILANVGASEYIIEKGDVVRWDYHSWNLLSFISAEILDFPIMFTKGYGEHIYPTIIGYDAQNERYAEELVDYFTSIGLKNITAEPMKKIGSERSKANLVLIGQGEIVDDIMKAHTQLNLRYYLQGEYVVDYLTHKKFQGAFGEVLQSPFNPKGIGVCENVVLVITGVQEYIPQIVNMLIQGKMQSFWCVEGEGL